MAATATKNQTLVGGPVKSSGGISSAALGTTLPEKASANLDAAFTALGLAGEDGVSEKTSRGSNKVKAWGGSDARVVQDDFGVEYTFTLLETGEVQLKEIHGAGNVEKLADVTVDELKIKINKEPLPNRAFVFDIKDGDTKVRIVVPNGQITDIDEIKYTHKDVTAYALTVTAYEDGDGNNAYKYLARPKAKA